MNLVIEAWDVLDSDRNDGWSVGAIPWTAVDAWTRAKQLDPDVAELLEQVLRTLDHDYLAAIASKQRLQNT